VTFDCLFASLLLVDGVILVGYVAQSFRKSLCMLAVCACLMFEMF